MPPVIADNHLGQLEICQGWRNVRPLRGSRGFLPFRWEEICELGKIFGGLV